MDFATFGKTYPKVTDFTTNKDPDGIQIQYSRSEDVVQLSGSCIEGDVLVYVSPTTTAPLTAAKMGLVGTTATIAHRFAGIALSPGASGDVIKVCKNGPCLVNTDADATSFAIGDLAIAPTTTAGKAGRVAAASAAATAIIGTGIGHFMGAGTTTQALVNVHHI